VLEICGLESFRAAVDTTCENGFLHGIAIPEIFARARGPRQLPS
jgi:hypothetical protein